MREVVTFNRVPTKEMKLLVLASSDESSSHVLYDMLLHPIPSRVRRFAVEPAVFKEKMITWMKQVGACANACDWVEDRTPTQAWRDCQRPSWMLWALGRTSVDTREIVRIACDIALSVLPLNEDPRITAAIDAAEGWCAGEVSAEECRTVTNAAAYAVTNADAYATDGDAAYATAYVAAHAAITYDAAYLFITYDAATREEVEAEIADLIRTRITPAQFAKLVKI